MARRTHVERVTVGVVVLGAEEAHHVRDVLRMGCGDRVEVFDDGGRVGAAVITRADARGVEVAVESVRDAAGRLVELTVVSAIPKGPRADWMIEKLSELGVERFVPLVAARSVVVPEGKNKLDRWRRIGLEAAKQSRRAGVMEIEEPAPLVRVLGRCTDEGASGCVATTELPDARAVAFPAHLAAVLAARSRERGAPLWIFIGPEGGWEVSELEAMGVAHLTPVSLGPTILRVETAAVAAAAIVAAQDA